MEKKKEKFIIVRDSTKEVAQKGFEEAMQTITKKLKKHIDPIIATMNKLPAHTRLNMYANLIDILFTTTELPPYLKRGIMFEGLLAIRPMPADLRPKEPANYIG